MTKEQSRRRKKFRKIGAWTLLLLVELFLSAIPATVTAAVALPLAYAERGYAAMGSEWLIIAVVFCIAYAVIHNKICNTIFEEE